MTRPNSSRPHLHILDISKDGNGHVTVKCRIDDSASDPVHGTGAVELLGIDAMEIESRYNGNVRRWLHRMGMEMLRRHRSRTAVHDQLGELKGKRIELRDDPSASSSETPEVK